MTHGPMRESDGVFSMSEDTDCECRHCHAFAVTVRQWDSNCGGYEDYKYTCGACGHVWWIEGIDS